jgi:hypothetical protein
MDGRHLRCPWSEVTLFVALLQVVVSAPADAAVSPRVTRTFIHACVGHGVRAAHTRSGSAVAPSVAVGDSILGDATNLVLRRVMTVRAGAALREWFEGQIDSLTTVPFGPNGAITGSSGNCSIGLTARYEALPASAPRDAVGVVEIVETPLHEVRVAEMGTDRGEPMRFVVDSTNRAWYEPRLAIHSEQQGHLDVRILLDRDAMEAAMTIEEMRSPGVARVQLHANVVAAALAPAESAVRATRRPRVLMACGVPLSPCEFASRLASIEMPGGR